MKKSVVDFMTRQTLIESLVRYVVQCYRMYFRNNGITAEIVSSSLDKYVIRVFCLNDVPRAALLMFLSSVLNERVYMKDGFIMIEIQEHHPCLSEDFSPSENNI